MGLVGGRVAELYHQKCYKNLNAKLWKCANYSNYLISLFEIFRSPEYLPENLKYDNCNHVGDEET